MVPMPPGSMLLVQHSAQPHGGFGWTEPSHAFLTGASIDPPHAYRGASAASSFAPGFTLSVPWTASATHAAPTSALEAASLRKIEAAKDAARQVRMSKLAAELAAQKRASAAASSTTATSAVATSTTARGRKRKGESSSAAGSKKSKAAASAAATVDADELQFEVEFLLGKRVRLLSTALIRRMKNTEDPVTGRNAFEVCQKDLEELMEEEMAAKRGGAQGNTSAAAAAASSSSSRTSAASSFFPYSSLDPLVQLPLVEYLIRWKGYSASSDSWEPRWNIHHAMIVEFEGRVDELTRKPRHQLDPQAQASLASMSTRHPALTDIESAKAAPAGKGKSKATASSSKKAAAAPTKRSAATVASSAPKGSRSRPAPLKP